MGTLRLRARLALALSAALAAAFIPAPQASASTATVTFGLTAGTHLPTGAACPLEVAAGADGLAVLDAAQDALCIESYEAEHHPQFGSYVACINRICGAPEEALFLTFWVYYLNGAPAPVGVDGYQAADGDEIVWSYETWLACLVPDGC